MPAPLAAEQRVCTEDGVIFAAGRSDQKTCSGKCRTRRSRREARGGAEPYGAARRAEILAGIRATAEEGAVAMAQEILRDEIIRPLVREQMTPEVLNAIGAMVRLLPDTVRALDAEINGYPATDRDTHLPLRGPDGKPILIVDHDRRMKAIAAVHRATVLSPGLAPAPASEKQPPVAINFGAVPRPSYDVTATRECAICEKPRHDHEFIDGSDRCLHCQGELEAAAQELIADAPSE